MNDTVQIQLQWDQDVQKELESGTQGIDFSKITFIDNDGNNNIIIERSVEHYSFLTRLLSTVYATLLEEAFQLPSTSAYSENDDGWGDGNRVQIGPESTKTKVALTCESAITPYYDGDLIPWPPDSTIATLEISTRDYIEAVIAAANEFAERLETHWPSNWREDYPRLAKLLRGAEDIDEYLENNDTLEGYELDPSDPQVQDYCTQEEYTDPWFERFLADTGVLEGIVERLYESDDDQAVQDRYGELLSRTHRTDYFRISLVETLTNRPDPRAEKWLRGCLFEDNPELVLGALRALDQIGGPVEVYPLCLVLGEHDQEPIRELAAEQLANFPADDVANKITGMRGFDSDDGVEILRNLAEDDDNETVRRVAQAHLDELES